MFNKKSHVFPVTFALHISKEFYSSILIPTQSTDKDLNFIFI